MGQIIPFKCVTQQIFSLAVAVDLPLGVEIHDIFHEVQVAERHSGFQTVDADAAVSPEHIVHMQLPNPLLCLLLESFRAGSEIGVFISKQLIGNLAGEQHPQIRMLVDVLAHQIHTNGSTDGGNIIGSQQRHHVRQCCQHILLGDNHLGVVSPQVIRHLLGIFQVDGIDVHANGKGADGLFQVSRRHGTHQAGIQAAGQQEANRRVRVQPLENTGFQLVVNLLAGGFHIVLHQGGGFADIPVADELAILIIMPRREGKNTPAQPHQILRLTGEDDFFAGQIPIVQWADADGVTGGNQLPRCPVIENHGKLCIQHPKHIRAVLPVQGQQQLAIGLTLEGIPLLFQLLFQQTEAIQFPIAHHRIPEGRKRLHSVFIQPHDGEAVETQKAITQIQDAGHVRASGNGSFKIAAHFFFA